jgi:hypothetical protein
MRVEEFDVLRAAWGGKRPNCNSGTHGRPWMFSSRRDGGLGFRVAAISSKAYRNRHVHKYCSALYQFGIQVLTNHSDGEFQRVEKAH